VPVTTACHLRRLGAMNTFICHRLQGNFDEASLIESYLGILSAAVAERRFLQRYNRSHPLDDDVDMFTQMDIKL